MKAKHKILEILERNRGNCVSGEEIAKTFDMSRSAIWKAIKELREEGYKINAVTNKGYSLLEENDILSSEGISMNLEDKYEINVYKELPSTNEEAKRLAILGASHGTIIIANTQTMGKGRMGRKFYSPKDSGIYMSIILRPKLKVSDSVLITTAASVAVCRAIEAVSSVEPKIKWVNDIYAFGKKVCGILTEAGTDFESGNIEYVILGIGINFTTEKESFPLELQNIAGSIYSQETNHINRNKFISEIIKEIFRIMKNIENRDFIKEYKERSLVIGKNISICGPKNIVAKALDIDENGGLLVRLKDGNLRTLNSGEISIRGEF